MTQRQLTANQFLKFFISEREGKEKEREKHEVREKY